MQVVDSNGVESMAKFQICKGLCRNKVLVNVSRLVQNGYSVAFQEQQKQIPELHPEAERVVLHRRLGEAVQPGE